MSTKDYTEFDVEMLIRGGSMGLVNTRMPGTITRECYGSLFASSWVEQEGDTFRVYIDEGCPIILSNKLCAEFVKKFPNLADKITSVNDLKRANGKSNLMLVLSGALIVDSVGNIATLVSNSATAKGYFAIPGGFNSEHHIKDNSIIKTSEQLAAIGIKAGKKAKKLISIYDDLDYERIPSSTVKQYYYNNAAGWEKTDTFQAYAFIDKNVNTLFVVKIGYFSGILVNSIDASDWDRQGALVHADQITTANSTGILYKTAEQVIKYFNNKTISILTDC